MEEQNTYIFKPQCLKGEIHIPASKSHMQRALAAALLSKGETHLLNPSTSADCLSAGNVIELLGAKIEKFEDQWIVASLGIQPPKQGLNVGESGLGIRMFSPIASLLPIPIEIRGEGSLKTRPLGFFEEVLPKLGVKCTAHRGCLPLQMEGPLQGGEIDIDGSLSSQFLTGLLMALPLAKEDSILHVKKLKSKPYIDMTLKVLSDFGIHVKNESYSIFRIKGNQQYQAVKTEMEGDWSGAAFWVVAAALGHTLTLKGLQKHSTQADACILHIVELMGAKVIFEGGRLEILPPKERKPLAYSLEDAPDLFPPVAALCAQIKGVSYLKGAQRLAHKESNRAVAIQKELGKAGILVEIEGDTMIIHGNGKIKSYNAHAYEDHRMAMMAAIMALDADGSISINDIHCVNKSYPDFFKHFLKVGGILQ